MSPSVALTELLDPTAVSWPLTALLAGVLIGVLGLSRSIGRLLHPRADDPPLPARQLGWLVGGLAMLWLALASPLHHLGEHHLVSAHVLQHLLIVLVAAPMLLLGTPRWLAELGLRPRGVPAVLAALTRPWFAGSLLAVVVVAAHAPGVLDASTSVPALHAAWHLALVLAALLAWVPVLSPVPALLPRLVPPVRAVYVLALSLVPTVPASLLTLAGGAVYPAYELAVRPGALGAADDVRLAGALAKVGGGVLLWTVAAAVFFRWTAAEERRAALRARLVAAGPTEPPASILHP